MPRAVKHETAKGNVDQSSNNNYSTHTNKDEYRHCEFETSVKVTLASRAIMLIHIMLNTTILVTDENHNLGYAIKYILDF